MAFLKWEEKYSTGIPSMDSQHQKLVQLINALHTAMIEGRGNDVMIPVLDRLVTYTTVHFNAEESLMKLHHFPDLDAHMMEHEKLKQQVSDFQTKVTSGQTSVSVQVLQFLKEWLLDHILKADKQYGGYLSARGVK
ncbi:bacteriohemerythrin [bacterium]|nr:bacteriohemerythrin [bacterium]